MSFGHGGAGSAVGFGGSLVSLKLDWIVEELRGRGLLPAREESPDLLDLLDRFVLGKPLAGKPRARVVEVERRVDGADMLKVRDVARVLGVCDKTVRKMIGDGNLPSVRVRGAVRVQRRDVDRWVSARKEGS